MVTADHLRGQQCNTLEETWSNWNLPARVQLVRVPLAVGLENYWVRSARASHVHN